MATVGRAVLATARSLRDSIPPASVRSLRIGPFARGTGSRSHPCLTPLSPCRHPSLVFAPLEGQFSTRISAEHRIFTTVSDGLGAVATGTFSVQSGPPRLVYPSGNQLRISRRRARSFRWAIQDFVWAVDPDPLIPAVSSRQRLGPALCVVEPTQDDDPIIRRAALAERPNVIPCEVHAGAARHAAPRLGLDGRVGLCLPRPPVGRGVVP